MEWERELSHMILNPNIMHNNISLPEYKFYTKLALDIMSHGKNMGAEYQEPLRSVRIQAQQDFQFQFKILDLFWQGVAQYFVIFSITWGFSLVIKYFLKMEVQGDLSIMALSLQGLGVMIFIASFHYLSHKKLKVFDDFFSSLYIFKALISLNLPFKFICEKSELSKLIEQKTLFSDIQCLISEIVSQVLSHGGFGVSERIDSICSEMRYKQMRCFDKVEQSIAAVKLIVILFFFVPAYLLNIWAILGNITTL